VYGPVLVAATFDQHRPVPRSWNRRTWSTWLPVSVLAFTMLLRDCPSPSRIRFSTETLLQTEPGKRALSRDYSGHELLEVHRYRG
jgi:hypothetical protein